LLEFQYDANVIALYAIKDVHLRNGNEVNYMEMQKQISELTRLVFSGDRFGFESYYNSLSKQCLNEEVLNKLFRNKKSRYQIRITAIQSMTAIIDSKINEQQIHSIDNDSCQLIVTI
jgi:hypothetical protein